jgi:hypothetical protein
MLTGFPSESSSPDRIQKAAQESQSLEEFLEACFDKSLQDICITPPHLIGLIPDLCSLVQGKDITDRSYYDGYKWDPNKAAGRNSSLCLREKSLFLNDYALQCNLGDPALLSFRIQLQTSQQWREGKNQVVIPEVGLYFDFWDEEKGFSRKCVILYVKLDQAKFRDIRDKITRLHEKEAAEHVQALNTNPISTTQRKAPAKSQLNLL